MVSNISDMDTSFLANLLMASVLYFLRAATASGLRNLYTSAGTYTGLFYFLNSWCRRGWLSGVIPLKPRYGCRWWLALFSIGSIIPDASIDEKIVNTIVCPSTSLQKLAVI